MELDELITQEYEKSKAVIAKKLQWYARRYHRYRHRTRTLMRSTTPVLNKSLNVGLQATAFYAPFVINGHGTWLPDPFIDNALQKNRAFVRNQYKTVAARAVRKYNAQNRRNKLWVIT